MVSTQASFVAAEKTEPEPLTVGLWLIVLLKAVSAALLWSAFVLLLFARRSDPQDFFSRLVFHIFRGNPPGMAIRYISQNMDFVTKTMVTRVAFATALYALVESTEAAGLILRKLWAEWLVILVTVSFIPLEIAEIVMRPRPLKVLTLIANLLVMWYLLRRLLEKRAARRAILRSV